MHVSQRVTELILVLQVLNKPTHRHPLTYEFVIPTGYPYRVIGRLTHVIAQRSPQWEKTYA